VRGRAQSRCIPASSCSPNSPRSSARDKFTRRIRNARLSAAGLVAGYQQLAVLADPDPLPAPIRRDSDDDHVLACALAAEAALIVSGDDDLLSLGRFRDIPILAAREALEVIASGTR
jgi:predicted nucleic acid-binding protein